jgi:hypothetical protein
MFDIDDGVVVRNTDDYLIDGREGIVKGKIRQFGAIVSYIVLFDPPLLGYDPAILIPELCLSRSTAGL